MTKTQDIAQFMKLMDALKIRKENQTMISITSGKIETAKKVVIYGPEGIGKSTLASKFPGVVFIDTEGSTKELDVMRYPAPQTWNNILEEVEDAAVNRTCKTLAIDTADWAEQLCSLKTCSDLNVRGIEDVGYGKGYTYLAEEVTKLLTACNKLIAQGINVVFTAHAQMRKFEQPDELGAYDRWEMKLSKKCAALLKEWADIVLFCNYKTNVITDQNTKSKKATGGKRVMYTTHHPCWDAKNRFGLDDELPMEFAPIANLFSFVQQDSTDYRSELRKFIQDNKLDSAAIASTCGLNAKSTNEDYRKAYDFAVSVKDNKNYRKDGK